MTIDLDVGLCRSSTVLWREAGGSLVLLPEGSTRPIIVNGSATDLWALLAEPTSATEMTAILGRFYGMPVEAIERDIATVLQLLLELGAVQPEHGP